VLSGKNIALSLEENALRRGSHPAIIDGGKTTSYRELDGLVKRTSEHLKQQGAAEGAIIGVGLKDTSDHLVVNYAIARLGAIILPLDWRWTDAEKQNVCHFFGVAFVIVEEGMTIEKLSCIELNIDWHSNVARQSENVACASGGARPVVLSLSSGTTGRPKGPMLTHDQFTARFVMQWVTLGFNQHDRYLSATPIYFGGGRSFTMGCLFSGSTVIMFPPPYEPEELVAAVVTHQATTLLLVPTLLRRLLQMPKGNRPLLAGLNRLLSTGAILHPDERDAVMSKLNPNFINYYGSTEGGGTSVLLPKHNGDAAHSVGEPIYQTDIQIVDENGHEKAVDEAGLIRYRSPGVSDSFYNDPDSSAEAFRDGWFYPGDIGKLDDEGLLYLVGRAKDVIIRSGINIYPAEIEQVLTSHPSVTDAVAVAWPHPDRGEDVAAFIVQDKAISEEELIDYCRENLASYKVPSCVIALEELPKTGLGKIIKSDLISQLPKC
jgi:acyl-CoA synthetase (AMP-forming)/AMP-acid ligase II